MMLATTEVKITKWQDWTVFAVHWLLLIGFSATIYFWQSQESAPITISLGDLAIIFGLGAVGMVVFAASMFIRQIQVATPFILLVTDIALTVLIVLTTEANQGFVLSATLVFAILGLLRQGATWGTLQALGVVVGSVGAVISISDVNSADALNNLILTYGVTYGLIIITVAMVGAWVYARDRFDATATLNKIARVRARQVEDMRERARTISDMTNALVSSSKFEQILEATLDIGQISLRKNAQRRLVGLVMLFREYDGMLYVANYRGVRHIERDRTIPGKTGIIGRTLTECVPLIGDNPANDPELVKLGVFKGIRSVLTIPLRANYDNYGILIYGSEEYNAFNEDHIDTLYAIGVQATVALQNSVLYSNLMQEKERIIEMEEDARKALVRDLHDIPTQTISAVAMRLSIARRMLERDPSSVASELEAIEGMTRETIEQIRHVLFTLRPLALEDQGLTAALQQLAEKTQKTHHQPVTVQVGADVEHYLDENQQGAVFYLIEEAVNNARKYANASLIRVQVARQNELLAVRISDNGQGFDMSTMDSRGKGSFGMTNMRERVELLDGDINIKSAPGRGTTITALIPVDLDRSSSNGHKKESSVNMKDSMLAARAKDRLQV